MTEVTSSGRSNTLPRLAIAIALWCVVRADAELTVGDDLVIPAPAAVRFCRHSNYSVDIPNATFAYVSSAGECQPGAAADGDAAVDADGTVVVAPLVDYSCLERTCSRFASLGARAVIVYVAGVGHAVTSGGAATMVTADAALRDAVAGSDVPCVEISVDDATRLREFVGEQDAKPVRVRLRPSPNVWLKLFRGTAWTVIVRVLAPLGFMAVAVLSVAAAAAGGPQWRSTRFFVVWLELVPAIVLAVACALDVYGEPLLPREVALFLVPTLRCTKLASTVLLTRLWSAHAAAFRATDPAAPARDPVSIDLGTSLGVTAFLIGLDALAGWALAKGPSLFTLVGLIFALQLVGEVLCITYFCISAHAVLTSRGVATGDHAQLHVLRRHLLASCLFMGLDIATSLAAALSVFATDTYFLPATAGGLLARIGTASCQLLFFLNPSCCLAQVRPHSRHRSSVAPDPEPRPPPPLPPVQPLPQPDILQSLRHELEEAQRTAGLAERNFAQAQRERDEAQRQRDKARHAARDASRLADNRARLEVVEQNRSADRWLNHVIRNTVGGAKMALEMAAPDFTMLPAETCRTLAHMASQLDSAVSWIEKRELFQQLRGGSYRSRRTAYSLATMLEDFAVSRSSGGGAGGVSVTVSHLLQGEGGIVLVDVSVLQLVLVEAMSNARKCRAKGTPIEIRAHRDAARHAMVVINVRHVNAPGTTILSEAECGKLFGRNTTAVAGAASAVGGAALSGSVGLDTAMQAATAAGGTVGLSMSTEYTVFWLKLPAEPVRPAKATAAAPQDDASAGEAGALVGRSVGVPAPSAPSAPAATAEFKLINRSVKELAALVPPDGRRLGCMGLDDSSFLQLVLATLFKTMGAKNEDVVVHGATLAEQTGFVALVLERRPHVVVLDQNIDKPQGGPHLLGTDLAAELQLRGFSDGVVCILSGASEKDLEAFRGKPGVDLVYGKGKGTNVIAEGLRRALQAKWANRAAAAATKPRVAADGIPEGPSESCNRSMATDGAMHVYWW